MLFTAEPSKWTGNAIRIPASDGSYYFCGTLLLLRLWTCRLTFFAKESRPSLQEVINLPLVGQLMKGLPQLPALSGGVSVLFVKLRILLCIA